MAAKARIEDTGKKIGGARKDRWRERALALADLADLNPEEAGKFVTKDLVWPVDYAALVEDGMPANVAALVKQCRDRMAAKPVLTRYGAGTREVRDPDAVRRDFITMTGIARDVLVACRTERDVAEAGRVIRTNAGMPDFRGAPPAAQDLLWSVFKDRSYPFEIRHDEIRRAGKLVAEGFPESVPAWRKGLTVRALAPDAFVAIKGRAIIARGGSEQEVLDSVKADYEKSRADKANGPRMPDRPYLDVLTRIGMPDRRDGRSVTAQEFIDAFGFAGVEFGNWLPQDERQRVMDLAYDALMDLAEVLGVEPEVISFGGVMSLSFGSRGTGGHHSAHYEFARRVFNLTRFTGGGTIAHEWGHCLDHMAGEIQRETSGGGEVRSGSGWREWSASRLAETAHLGPAASSAWDGMMEGFRLKPRTREERVADLRRDGGALGERLETQRRRLEDYLAATPEGKRDRKFVKELGEWCGRTALRMDAMRVAADAAENGAEDLDFGKRQTSYMAQALALSGSIDGKFCRPNELFARSFECLVYDRLAERGAGNEYLVHGVDEGLYADPMFKGDPYPAGEERRQFASVVGRLLEEMIPILHAHVRRGADAPKP